MVECAIVLGIVFGLLLAPVFGYSAAGLVVPGYLALHFSSPSRIATTLGLALATWAVVEFGASRVFVLYGRRRLAITVLTGFVLTALFNAAWQPIVSGGMDLRIIGLIVPGLIANESLRQGFVPTVAMTMLIAALTRVTLLVVFPWVP